MTRYQTIQFAPDGDYITDYHCESVEEAWERVDNQGSRWFFYPLPFVITDGYEGIGRKRIVSCPEMFESFQGCTVAKVQADLASLTDDERNAIFV